jgi:hypothetical protein
VEWLKVKGLSLNPSTTRKKKKERNMTREGKQLVQRKPARETAKETTKEPKAPLEFSFQNPRIGAWYQHGV